LNFDGGKMKFDFNQIKDFFAELPANLMALSRGEQIAWGAIVVGIVLFLTGLILFV